MKLFTDVGISLGPMGNIDPRKDLQGLGRDFPCFYTFSNCFHLAGMGFPLMSKTYWVVS